MASDNALRIAWFSDIFSEVSGIYTETLEFLEEAAHHSVSCFPITCYSHDLYPFKVFDPVFSIPVSSFYDKSRLYVPNIFKVIQYLRSNNVNVIVSNTPASLGVVAMVSSCSLKIPWVDIYHTDVDFYIDTLSPALLRPFMLQCLPYLMRMYQKNADLIFARTQSFYNILLEKGIEKERLCIFRGGVNTNNYHPDKSCRKVWSQFGVNSNKIIVLFVGRISKVKDIHFLLDAFREFKYEFAELVIVGEGPELSYYQDCYKEQSNIHFLKTCLGEDLQLIYASSDLFVSPSSSETLGKTVLEAMASGLPILISDQGGLAAELNQDTAEKFKHQNYSDFVKKLNEMLADKERLYQLGKMAREKANEFSLANSVQGLCDNIRTLL